MKAKLSLVSLKHLSSEKGQALVEYALLLPILLALLIGMIEVGGAWSAQQAVTHAAREGARFSAIPNTTEEDIEAKIFETLAPSSLDADFATPVLRVRNGTGTADTVQVTYAYKFNMLGPIIRLVSSDKKTLPGTFTLSSTFIIRNE